MTTTKPTINGVRLLKKSVSANGKRCPVLYSVGHFRQMKDGEVVREGTGARIYAAKNYGELPAALYPVNDSDWTTDYAVGDRSPIYWQGTDEFDAVVDALEMKA